jgi:hypothetical protein
MSGIQLSPIDQSRVLLAFQSEQNRSGSTISGIICALTAILDAQDVTEPVFNSPRLIKALQAAMPLLSTQQDTANQRLHPVPAVFRPLTTAQTLRKQADELDREDAIVNELRSALREHLAVMKVRTDISEGKIS